MSDGLCVAMRGYALIVSSADSIFNEGAIPDSFSSADLSATLESACAFARAI